MSATAAAPQTARSPTPAAGRLPELDGVRGIAILAVMVYHYVGEPGLARLSGADAGWLGVDLFFVLSGFLITRILLGSRGKADYFRRFYSRRALRILPPFGLVLGLLLAAAFVFDHHQPWRYWLLHGLFLTSYCQVLPFGGSVAVPVFVATGVSVFWSLSVEEQFYLLWAPIVRRLRPEGLFRLLLALLLAEPVLRAIIGRPRVAYALFPTRLDDLCVGALLALLEVCPESLPRAFVAAAGWMLRRGLWLGALATALVLAWGPYATASYGFEWLGYSFVAIGMGGVVGHVLQQAGGNGAVSRALRWGWLRRVGIMSYTLYMVHMGMRMAVDGMLESHSDLHTSAQKIGARGVAAILSLGFAWLSWRYLESPLLARNHSGSVLPVPSLHAGSAA